MNPMLKILILIAVYVALFLYMYIYNKIKSYGPSSGHIKKLMIVSSLILFIFIVGFKEKIILVKTIAVLIYFVSLFLLVRSYYNSKENETKASAQISWPPKSYQDNIGDICPDYWFKGISENNDNVCINKFNIPINDNCFKSKSDGGGGYLKGTNDKEILLSNFETTDGKCNWVKKCGVREDTFGSWTGIDKGCGTLNLLNDEDDADDADDV